MFVGMEARPRHSLRKGGKGTVGFWLKTREGFGVGKTLIDPHKRIRAGV